MDKKAVVINKADLIESIATSTGLSKKDSEAALKATITKIQESVANGDKVQIVGFGSFEKRKRAERQGRNPKTQETMTIPACNTPAFKAGKEFKDLVK